MKLKKEGKAVVVPILLSDCSGTHEDFKILESLPRKGELVSSFNPREKAWALVEIGIMKAVEKFRKNKSGLGKLF